MATGKRIVQKDILSKLRQSQGFQTISVMKIAATNWKIRVRNIDWPKQGRYYGYH